MSTVRTYIGNGPDTALVILDIERRTYAALSRDGSRWHLIQPLELNNQLVGDGKRLAGELGCTCQAGIFKGSCYRVAQAEAYEASIPKAPTWFDAPEHALGVHPVDQTYWPDGTPRREPVKA